MAAARRKSAEGWRESKMKDIKVGFIGLGGRGYSLMRWVVLEQGEHVTAVCDVYEDRTKAGADAVEEAGCERPAEYLDYHDVIKDENVNTIIIATAWESHVEIALAALYAGIYCAGCTVCRQGSGNGSGRRLHAERLLSLWHPSCRHG